MNQKQNAALEARIEARIKEELTAVDMESRYDEMLDECYSFESVGGIFANMSPSRVLREVDPVAYRCGFNDYTDGESRGDNGLVEVNEEFYDADEVDAIRDEVEARAA